MRKYLIVMLLGLMSCCASAFAADNENPLPPDDAMFTIYCKSFSGPTRVGDAKITRDALAKSTGMKGFYVVHSADESTLFYGYYRSLNTEAEDSQERKDAERAKSDRRKLLELKDADGQRIFVMCSAILIQREGSEGPPEWDLTRTPPDAFWSVLIAVYRDNPDRKKVAVEAVRQLRSQQIDAYYLHGPISSLIFIGTWPRTAIREQESDVAKVDDPNVELRVIDTPLPPNAPREYVTPEGKKIRWIAPQIDITDPSLRRTLDRYPEFMTNGEVFRKRVRDPKTKLEHWVPDHSVLYIIPRKSASILDGTTPQAPLHPEVLQQIQPKAPASAAPGAKKLKSLDD